MASGERQGILQSCIASDGTLRVIVVGADSGNRAAGNSAQGVWQRCFDATTNSIRVVI